MAFGDQIEWYEEISSTMEAAAAQGRKGAPEGLLVVAERQRAGRGRLGRTWFSPPGGLWLSLLLRPTLPADSTGLLGICFAVAAADGISAVTGLRVGIRWPNDLFIEKRKLGGMLVEAHSGGKGQKFAVLGVGVNVNIPAEGFPEWLRPLATSLLIETGTCWPCQRLLREFLQRAEPLYRELLSGGDEEILGKWAESDIGRGRRVRVVCKAGLAEGEACGIDSQGALLVRDGERVRAVTSGETEWL